MIWQSLGIIALASAVVWYFSGKLESVAAVIGSHLRMPDSVKGALLYAIPSSFPELATATLAVIALEEPVFSVGVGTICGSAVFNLLIIPALSVLVASAYLKKRGKKMDAINVSPTVFMRDGVFYLVVVVLFIVAVTSGVFSKGFAILFLSLYGGYVVMLYFMTRQHRAATAHHDADEPDMTLGVASFWLISSTGMIGVACYFLVEHTIEVAHYFEVNAYVVAVIITAAATSVPDTIISIAAAKQGGEDSEESIVNAFSSNIFDILICLAVPALLFPGELVMDVNESIVSLVLLAVTTFITLAMIRVGNRVTKGKAYVLLGMYVAFVASALFNGSILELLGIELG